MSEFTRTGIEVVRVRDRNTGHKYTISKYGVLPDTEIIDEPAVTQDGRIREPEFRIPTNNAMTPSITPVISKESDSK